MNAAAGYRIGRGWLQVTPGASGRLFLHDIAAPAPARAQRLDQARRDGAWTYVQRGHAPSTSAGGGVYRISDFALDLLRLLRDAVPTPVLISAEGASGLVSALAASTEPGLVRGLQLLPAPAGGWGSDPGQLVSGAGEPNRSWLPAVLERRRPRVTEDDPILRVGPPETMPERAVAAALGGLDIPWAATPGHFLEPWLPGEHRSPAPGRGLR